MYDTHIRADTGTYIYRYYTSLMCKECFVQNYFVRTFILNDTLKKIRMLIEQHQTDPENIKRIRLPDIHIHLYLYLSVCIYTNVYM